ncbi:hypothetical protein AAC03nite_37870 [Alicyclobacillus acidoterrestris]|nr:hypothetical protein AAC03nite_37870 [Alicyclobacillus acidoterrestris]
MEYEDIQERLSVLRTVSMPFEREEDITSHLQNEIEKYKQRNRRKSWSRQLGGIGSVSAALVVCAVGLGAILYHGHSSAARPNSTTATQGQGQNQISTAVISYTHSQLSQIQQTAQAVGVSASIPSQGTPGDVLTIVKNGGKGNLILDYTNIWVIESASPIEQPFGITTLSNITVGGQAATYMANTQNSFLRFQRGNTYIMIENLVSGNPISQQNMQAIGASFQPVQ